MIIGFTGTREGMTPKQYEVVVKLIGELKPDIVLHGDCKGADEEFHKIIEKIRGNFGNHPIIRILPPRSEELRAFCQGDIIDPQDDYNARNRKIANLCDKLIATPKESKEQLRSGTWTTIRYGRLASKIVYIVTPNGEIR